MPTRPSSSSPGLRESIRYPATGERKYIRYFDGRGHFAHVCIQLLPRPGAPCSVSVDSACTLPEDVCDAVRAALLRRFERGARRRLPLIGIEARLLGGSYLPQHSYPAACAIAACMAWDEAWPRTAPVVLEPWIGVSMQLPWGAATLERLIRMLGEMHVIANASERVSLRIEIPWRLLPAVQAACEPVQVQTFPLTKPVQYRELSAAADPPGPPTYFLDEWT